MSNSAGTNDDLKYRDADDLERNIGVPVLRHSTKKPGCHQDVLEFFAPQSLSPSEIAVIGDRLFTDIVMANLMGAYGIWVCDGIVPSYGMFARMEKAIPAFLLRRGYSRREL